MVLLQTLGLTSLLINLKVSFSPNLDNYLFKLHYKLTTPLLIVCSLLIDAGELIGDKPINCITYKTKYHKWQRFVDTYCWINSTYTIGLIDDDRPIMKVGAYDKGADDRVYHLYYQWVPIVLFFQVITKQTLKKFKSVLNLFFLNFTSETKRTKRY